MSLSASSSPLSSQAATEAEPLTSLVSLTERTPLLACARDYAAVVPPAPAPLEIPIAVTQPTNLPTAFLPSYGDHYNIPLTRWQFWWIFGPILAQYFVAMFDSSFMMSSHPVITSYFNASNTAAWLSTSFMLTTTAFQPVWGRVSDTLGRKPVYLACLGAFLFTTAWCGLAQSIESFIAARAATGIAAAGMSSVAYVMCTDLVKIEVRGIYQSWINLLYTGGVAFGAAFGGVLCDLVGWRWTFGMQILPMAIIWLIAYYNVPDDLGPNFAKNSGQHWWASLKEFDFIGALFLVLAIAGLVLGINIGGTLLPWSHPFVITSLVVCVLSTVTLLLVERHARRPIVPLYILSNPPRANMVFSNMCVAIGANHLVFNAPLFFQAVKAESATLSGLHLTPSAIAATISSVFVGLYVTKTGKIKSPQIIGSTFHLIGAGALVFANQTTPSWFVMWCLCFPAAGNGLSLPTATIASLAISSKDDQAVMATTLMLFRNTGAILGVAIGSLILQNALLACLKLYITAPNKDDVIQQLMLSVKAILDLKGQVREEAVKAYAVAIRLVFISGLGFYVVSSLALLPMRLPNIRKIKSAGFHDEINAENAEND